MPVDGGGSRACSHGGGARQQEEIGRGVVLASDAAREKGERGGVSVAVVKGEKKREIMKWI